MPTEFRPLVDWINLPPPSPQLERVIQIHVIRGHTGETPGSVTYDGFARYTPAKTSRFLPEHFSGVAHFHYKSGWPVPSFVNFTLAVTDRYGIGGFTWSDTGRRDELNLEHAEDLGGGVIQAQFENTGRYIVVAYLWGGLHLLGRYDHEASP